MNAYKKLYIVFAVTAIINDEAHAQVTKNYFEAGLSTGTTIYQGDLALGAFGNYKKLRPAFSMYGGKWIDKYFLLQGSFTHATIMANDTDWKMPAYKQVRRLNFHTFINEADVRIVFSPLGNAVYTPEKRWYPYAFVGAGVAFTHVKRNMNNIDSSFYAKQVNNFALDSAHKLPSVIPSLPFGAGVRYVMSPHISLFAEVVYRLPVTDYLDGFSYLGNPQRKDNYYNYSIGLNYTIFKNANRCPKVKR